jgi:hypothetical protein
MRPASRISRGCQPGERFAGIARGRAGRFKSLGYTSGSRAAQSAVHLSTMKSEESHRAGINGIQQGSRAWQSTARPPVSDRVSAFYTAHQSSAGRRWPSAIGTWRCLQWPERRPRSAPLFARRTRAGLPGGRRRTGTDDPRLGSGNLGRGGAAGRADRSKALLQPLTHDDAGGSGCAERHAGHSVRPCG